jgi:hypothetical protein
MADLEPANLVQRWCSPRDAGGGMVEVDRGPATVTKKSGKRSRPDKIAPIHTGKTRRATRPQRQGRSKQA